MDNPRFVVHSTTLFRKMVLWLSGESCWFEVNPLPCDDYEIRVKDDKYTDAIAEYWSLLQDSWAE